MRKEAIELALLSARTEINEEEESARLAAAKREALEVINCQTYRMKAKLQVS